ncbi:hypothetical protein AQUCO_01400425v1 [Aquilegia coerulea]|uniref:Uncharacterized protein n=1 Tax=Aquilegia coerulea TaxID=218851 RepID=A0A2G5DWE4_AQUCA|nr:hypothetical protein AQUCO_01400425v1 [Aquilegia coerulea]
MLLAVEGGGFFTSSATGYSKGLTLLLLGRKYEEKPMRISPWNQYQLVEQETDPDLQLASGKNQGSHGCAAFVCFGCTSSKLDGPSPPKVGPVQQQEILPKPSISDDAEDCIATDHGETENGRKVHLKSSLKKPSDCTPEVQSHDDLNAGLGENESDAPGCTQKRKVQWTDACGKDLVEIREFELSDVGDDESEGGNEQSCVCTIM